MKLPLIVARPTLTALKVCEIAENRGFGSRRVQIKDGEYERVLRAGAPMILRIREGAYVVVLRSRRNYVYVVENGGRATKLPVRAIANLLRAQTSGSTGGMACDRRTRLEAMVVGLLSAQRLRNESATVCWLLKPHSPSTGLRHTFLQVERIRCAVLIIGCHFCQFSLWITSWVLLVLMLLSASVEGALANLWVLSIGTMLILRTMGSWMLRDFALSVGSEIKAWILQTCLGDSAKDAQREGIGRMLAISINASRIDSLAVNGGIQVALGVLEIGLLLVMLYVLSLDALLMALLALLSVLVLQVFRLFREQSICHEAGLNVTAIHTEEMIGHRTRKSLVDVDAWYELEDLAFANYANLSRLSDRRSRVFVVVPRVWLLVGVMTTLIAEALSGPVHDPAAIWALGIVLLGFVALQSVVNGGTKLVDAVIAYRHVRNAFRLSDHIEQPGIVRPESCGGGLSVIGLTYRYSGAAKPIFDDFSLEMQAKARLLIEGRSGIGKSTLAKLVSGNLRASEGCILLDGLDLPSIGSSEWRRRICYVPQAHANYVLTAPFLFNLLMGREWPPGQESMRAARKVVKAVCLEDLVSRMPAGMMQMVGEGGWLLSQGEKARLFAARALLQDPDLLIVDEPLDALDPKTAMEMLTAIDDHDGAVLLIAHR